MFTFAIAALAFASEPSPVAQVPLNPQPRFVQVGTVPNSAPPPLAQVPAILNVTVNPPAPAASYIVTVTYNPTVKMWVGTKQGGAFGPGNQIGVSPYNPNQMFSRFPYTADQLYCRIVFLTGASLGDWGGGHIRNNTDNPYTAGPIPWGTGVSIGYSFTVGP